jgi:hypothetical protein
MTNFQPITNVALKTSGKKVCQNARVGNVRNGKNIFEVLLATLTGLHCLQPGHRPRSPYLPRLLALIVLTAARNVWVGQSPLAFLFSAALAVFVFKMFFLF